MKKIFYVNLLSLFLVSVAFGQTNMNAGIESAMGLIKANKNQQAAQKLLDLSNAATQPIDKARIKYLLGVSLMPMGLNQVAAFQFVESIRQENSPLVQKSLEKLLEASDKLGDETLLNFAIQRIDLKQFPAQNKEMLFYNLALAKEQEGKKDEAIEYYKKITSNSRYFYNALYRLGLNYAETSQNDLAIQSFNRLLSSRLSAKVTDTNKVLARMGLARVLYQKKDWSKAIEAYSKIPRDHVLWHESLFEKTWAMLRAGRFRSTLSNFQTLHSSYYEDFYLPETLLLRAIVYLYICQYDEMEKVLSLYETQYGRTENKINAFLTNTNTEAYYNEVEKIYSIGKTKGKKITLALPLNVMKDVSKEGDVKKAYAYLKKLEQEKLTIDNVSSLKTSNLGSYSYKIIQNRINATKVNIGNLVKSHLQAKSAELRDLNEQASFVRYEMINGQKENLRKKVTGKAISSNAEKDEKDRSFYIENGYEYYPFQGEYWLDEVGNYHYLGKQSCEQ